MACVVGGGTIHGVMKATQGGSTPQVYVGTPTNALLGAYQMTVSLGPIGCAVIDISVNNGDYRLSSTLAPFKFQWADVATVSNSGTVSTDIVTITGTWAKISVGEDCVVPVWDNSASSWKDVYAAGLTTADKFATIDVDAASDGDALGVETCTAVTTTTNSDVRTVITFTTVDYFLCGPDVAKPMLLISGCAGSAINDLSGGSLAGP